MIGGSGFHFLPAVGSIVSNSLARRGRLGATLALLLCGIGLPCPGRAHEYWLTASNYAAAIGDTVSISAWVGTGFRGDIRGWDPKRSVGFRALDAAPRSLADGLPEYATTWARVPVSDNTGLLVTYVSNFARLELPAAAFDRYLALEGLTEPLALRRAAGGVLPGRERYRRCAKAWVGGRGATRYGARTGQPIELIPTSDPTREADLVFRVEFGGSPLPGALVRVWRQELVDGVPLSPASRDSVPPIAEVRSGRDGTVRLKLRGPGEYLVGAVHMEACANRAVADWESSWASFTFARPDPGRRGSRPPTR